MVDNPTPWDNLLDNPDYANQAAQQVASITAPAVVPAGPGYAYTGGAYKNPNAAYANIQQINTDPLFNVGMGNGIGINPPAPSPLAGTQVPLNTSPLFDLAAVKSTENTDTPPDGTASTTGPDGEVVVTAKKAANPALGYDNSAELAALRAANAQNNPQSNNPIANFMANHGTLRTILGTLGDAFLIQAGHNPIYQPTVQRAQMAQAQAGFTTNPAAAAERIAATGVPGAAEQANQLQEQSLTNKRLLAQQDFNNQYKTDVFDLRQQQVKAQDAYKQQQIEDKTRQMMGAIMQSAAASGDPKLYAAARARAIQLGQGRIQNFDPDIELPSNIDEYNTGYGMNAGQVARNLTSNASIQERANASGQRVAATLRGQDINAGIAATRTGVMAKNSQANYIQQLIDKQNQGQQLTPAEQKFFDKVTAAPGKTKTPLKIPGLANNSGPPPVNRTGFPQPSKQAPNAGQQFENGRVYKDANGNQARYVNGKFVPL